MDCRPSILDTPLAVTWYTNRYLFFELRGLFADGSLAGYVGFLIGCPFWLCGLLAKP